MTPEQVELARHALGLPNASGQSYRNHFVCGPGHSDFDNWQAMVATGEARARGPSRLFGGNTCFWLSHEAAKAALKPREKLDAEDFPISADPA